MNNVHDPITIRSAAVRLGGLRRVRFGITSWSLIGNVAAMTPRVPSGPNSRARVVKKCTRSTKRSRMGPDRTATAWVYKSMKCGRFAEIIGIRQAHLARHDPNSILASGGIL